MKSILIRDSTLREGMELPGVELSLKEKLKIAEMLDEMNVREIEIGMPYGIKSCLPLARAIKTNRMKIKTSALVLSYRSNWKDEINLAAESHIDRVEILVPTSDILLNLKGYYKIKKEAIPDLLHETVGYAKKKLKEVGLGFMDATRTNLNFLTRLMSEARDSKADRVIVYDTVGIATPPLMTNIVSRIKQKSSLPVLVHCHNDFGLATANSLAGIAAGADAVDVVANGLGDRGGNAAFEEVVLALETLHRVKTGIRLEKITAFSKLVEKKSRIRKCRVKAVVGEFTFLHSPVQHIRNAASGNRKGFEPFEPELIGAERKFAFTLPVDYSDALEPFLKKAGLSPDGKQRKSILHALSVRSGDRGLSEKQVLDIIKKFSAKTKR
jgi:isopropylmalate/homocitrate/citramalate synthase